MGRWDDKDSANYKYTSSRIKKIRYIIFAGFVIVGIVILVTFMTRSGVTVDIQESGSANSISTISIKINNNTPQKLENVMIQFDDNGSKINYGSINPFTSVPVTPEKQDFDFKKITVSANDGSLTIIKNR
ncbi:MAG: hypothetical protein DA328_01330 [Nitrososphaeraceae archaeon]|nr:hypothetical protein [Nitrososphaeraceae archaeon]